MAGIAARGEAASAHAGGGSTAASRTIAAHASRKSGWSGTLEREPTAKPPGEGERARPVRSSGDGRSLPPGSPASPDLGTNVPRQRVRESPRPRPAQERRLDPPSVAALHTGRPRARVHPSPGSPVMSRHRQRVPSGTQVRRAPRAARLRQAAARLWAVPAWRFLLRYPALTVLAFLLPAVVPAMTPWLIHATVRSLGVARLLLPTSVQAVGSTFSIGP